MLASCLPETNAVFPCSALEKEYSFRPFGPSCPIKVRSSEYRSGSVDRDPDVNRCEWGWKVVLYVRGGTTIRINDAAVTNDVFVIFHRRLTAFCALFPDPLFASRHFRGQDSRDMKKEKAESKRKKGDKGWAKERVRKR